MSVQNLTMIVSDNKKSVHEFGSLQHYCILSQVKLQILVLQLNVKTENNNLLLWIVC